MTKHKIKKRRKAAGRPLPKATDEDAEITLNDIEQAKAWARKFGSPAFVAMLDAELADDRGFE